MYVCACDVRGGEMGSQIIYLSLKNENLCKYKYGYNSITKVNSFLFPVHIAHLVISSGTLLVTADKFSKNVC